MVETLGVVGAGAMGAGIAQVAAVSGYRVTLFDLDAAAASKARGDIFARLDRLVEKGQLSADARVIAGENLHVAAALEEMANAAIVIEAIVEKLEPKQALFAALETIVRPEAILATNTSSLSVSAIARTCAHRERVCGLHFFNPVPLMKLVEVIAAPSTSASVISKARRVCERLGKTAIDVKDTPGFLVNLCGRAYVTEAQHIALEGAASFEAIDTIMRAAAGFRMGPFELMDFTGIDVNFPAAMAIWRGFQHEPRLKPTLLQEGLYEAGLFGRKSGRGFHDYRGAAAAVPPANYQPSKGATLAAYAPERRDVFAPLAEFGLTLTNNDDGGLILLAPRGEDATAAVVRLQLDPARCVAVDLIGRATGFVTLMAPPSGEKMRGELAAWFKSSGWGVAEIQDCPGFVAPRLLAMIGNLGCEIAQFGIAAPRDIDTSMKLAQNYPKGPLEWVDQLGPRATLDILRELQTTTGSDRYRPSAWLRRRADLGLSIYQREA